MYGQLSNHYWCPQVRLDITQWCRACLICVTHQVDQAIKPPLMPIPVAGPFDQVGVNVMSSSGNQYTVVFIDYLMKCPEVFATKDQSSLTIARLLVEQLISQHGVRQNYFQTGKDITEHRTC